MAREAVKSLIALAGVPSVVAYYGGVERTEGDIMIVKIQPHYEVSKDGYKVSVRISDCRVANVSLDFENTPL